MLFGCVTADQFLRGWWFALTFRQAAMIRLIEALNYRCLRYVHQPLDRFAVLVGANGSGKTTFLDVITFLGQLVSEGVEAAVWERTRNFQELVWKQESSHFELAVEAQAPEPLCACFGENGYNAIRYEVRVGIHSDTKEAAILDERGLVKRAEGYQPRKPDVFPLLREPPDTILVGAGSTHRQGKHRTIFRKGPRGNDNFYSEVHHKTGKGWFPSIRLGPRKSALGNLPDDTTKFPIATWFRQLLIDGIQSLMLNSLALRRPSPPGQRRGFSADGSNLPWVVAQLEEPQHRSRLQQWVAHLQTALPDLVAVYTRERPEDRHRYLVLKYRSDLEVPSWLASDGTLRLLALTLPAYVPDMEGVYLVEEPENGIHPRAIETVFQSLSSVYDAQILLATHSPVILSLAKPEQVLCFQKTEQGATDIVRGKEHPSLRDWRGKPDLSVLFASGVLG